MVAGNLAGVTPELGIWYDAESERMTGGDVTDTCAAFLNHMTACGFFSSILTWALGR